jgi:tRNA-specific 2-thiouridylase
LFPGMDKKKPEQQKKSPSIGMAMSGGVDSSVAAALLRQKGFAVHGFFMALRQPDLDDQIARVRRIADYLQMELTVIDLSRDFSEQVLDYCTTAYFAGKTPNPCMVCNAAIKFGRLLEEITARGLDYQATGHYVRIVRTAGSISRLLRGRDPDKDQSYFLARLPQACIARLQMPLGQYTKREVYKLAEKFGLRGLHGKESQDICFLQGRDLGDFLSRHHQRRSFPGPIVTLDNRIIGQHNGLINYTVGQRRGLGIPDATPYYVLGLDVENNRVIVGKKQDLLQNVLKVRDVNWIAGIRPELPVQLQVKIRYRHQAAPALLESCQSPAGEEMLRITFDIPLSAITPGQFAVFYSNDEVIGSGEICGQEIS